MPHYLLLVLAGLLAGTMNAVAGGGSFVRFPAMVLAGLPPIAANATSTVALFPGTLASTWAYRRDLRGVAGSGGCAAADQPGGRSVGAILLLVNSIPALLQRRAAFGVMPVPAIPAGVGELAELVADHRLGDEHGNVLASVVHGDRVTDHLREDVAASRPGLDDPLLAGHVELLHLLEEVVIAERAFLERASHGYLPRRRTIMRSVLLL